MEICGPRHVRDAWNDLRRRKRGFDVVVDDVQRVRTRKKCGGRWMDLGRRSSNSNVSAKSGFRPHASISHHDLQSQAIGDLSDPVISRLPLNPHYTALRLDPGRNTLPWPWLLNFQPALHLALSPFPSGSLDLWWRGKSRFGQYQPQLWNRSSLQWLVCVPQNAGRPLSLVWQYSYFEFFKYTRHYTTLLSLK